LADELEKKENKIIDILTNYEKDYDEKVNYILMDCDSKLQEKEKEIILLKEKLSKLKFEKAII